MYTATTRLRDKGLFYVLWVQRQLVELELCVLLWKGKQCSTEGFTSAS